MTTTSLNPDNGAHQHPACPLKHEHDAVTCRCMVCDLAGGSGVSEQIARELAGIVLPATGQDGGQTARDQRDHAGTARRDGQEPDR